MTFRFRPVLTVFAALGMAMLIALGVWQVRRLHWKLDLIAKVEARIAAEPTPFEAVEKRWSNGQDTEYTPVVEEGAYRNDLEAHVFGTLDGTPGYYIFTPLELKNSPFGAARYVYVNRGFVPQALKDPKSRPEGEISGPVTVRGLFRSPSRARGIARMVAPKDDIEGNSWYQRDPARFAAAAGISALPVYIDSSGKENLAEWPKGGTTRVEFYNHHLDYAITWFGLAAALFGVWLAYSLSRR